MAGFNSTILISKSFSYGVRYSIYIDYICGYKTFIFCYKAYSNRLTRIYKYNYIRVVIVFTVLKSKLLIKNNWDKFIYIIK